MKYLIFALCVCAASAASIQNDNGFYKPWQAKATAQAEVVPVVEPVKTVEVIEPVPLVKPIQPVQLVKSFQPVQSFQPIQSYQPVPPVVKTVVRTDNEATAQVRRFASEVNPDSYNYGYETENGIVAEASGVLRKVDNSDALTVQGFYKYIAADGTPVEVSYTADENGYQPLSSLLPVGPAIPEYVLRAQEYIRAHPVKVEIVKKL